MRNLSIWRLAGMAAIALGVMIVWSGASPTALRPALLQSVVGAAPCSACSGVQLADCEGSPCTQRLKVCNTDGPDTCAYDHWTCAAMACEAQQDEKCGE